MSRESAAVKPHSSGYLGSTTSTCGACGKLLPAKIQLESNGVFLCKHCPEHGAQMALVCSDPAYYLESLKYHRAGAVPLAFGAKYDAPCPGSCGLCPQHEQHVCMPVIEITDHCDLSCPICLVRNRASRHLTRKEVGAILDELLRTEGQVDVVNLSGGEPTLNPHFKEIVEECLARPEILRVSVSTNGLRLLEDEGLLTFLAERNVVVSLQFDGLEEPASETLRGRALAGPKMRLIDKFSALDAPLSLTVTVAAGVNEAAPAQAADLLFQRDHILSVTIQPAAYTGRASSHARPSRPTTIPDVLKSLGGSAGGRVHAEDFCPLPCSHPACFSLAFYLKVGGGEFLPVKKLVEADRYLCMVQNRGMFGTDAESFRQVQQAIYDLWSGPAALAPDSRKALGAVRGLIEAATSCGGYSPARALAAAERSVKSIFIHQFMDRETFDLSRVRKCCTVYPQPGGRLIPLCVRNCMERWP